MVQALLISLLACPEVTQILLTRNIPETLDLPADSRLTVIDNAQPQGFGANHNAAFQRCNQDFFCPLNPDIVLNENPFPSLLQALQETGAALVAPRVYSLAGEIEDSVRYFPTVLGLLKKLIFCDKGTVILSGQQAQVIDWVAGMFMLFDSTAFRLLQGFDPHYFLYYEDVDICYRARQKSLKVLIVPTVSVTHDAQRDSHKKLRHLRWHLQSMGRYFIQCRKHATK